MQGGIAGGDGFLKEASFMDAGSANQNLQVPQGSVNQSRRS